MCFFLAALRRHPGRGGVKQTMSHPPFPELAPLMKQCTMGQTRDALRIIAGLVTQHNGDYEKVVNSKLILLPIGLTVSEFVTTYIMAYRRIGENVAQNEEAPDHSDNTATASRLHPLDLLVAAPLALDLSIIPTINP